MNYKGHIIQANPVSNNSWRVNISRGDKRVHSFRTYDAEPKTQEQASRYAKQWITNQINQIEAPPSMEENIKTILAYPWLHGIALGWEEDLANYVCKAYETDSEYVDYNMLGESEGRSPESLEIAVANCAYCCKEIHEIWKQYRGGDAQ